jgi:PAS domain S-box-containing protein
MENPTRENDIPEIHPVPDDRFRLMVESIDDRAIILLDPSGIIQAWNVGARRIHQFAPKDVVGHHISILYTADAQAAGDPARELATATRDGAHELDCWRVREDGTVFDARVSLAVLRDSGGTNTGFCCITRDMTDSRRTEEQSEERLRMMVEGVQDYAIFMLDPDGFVRTWNSGAVRIKQYAAHEVVGKHFSIFYTPTEVEAGAPARELETAARLGKFEQEGWRVRKDGSVFWANVIVTALRDSSGALVGFSKVTRDLTERRNAEEAIQRSEARFAGIVRISEDAIISVDEHQTITLFNDGAEKIFGYSSAEVIGKRIDCLIPERFGRIHDTYIKNFGSSPDALRAMNERGSIFGLRKDGTEFPAEASISKFEVGGEKVLTVRLRDITERERAEEAVKRSEMRFAGIVRISEDAIISIDDNQDITMFNEGAEKIFGYKSDEVLGKKIDTLVPSRFTGVHGGYVKTFGSSADALRPMNERGSIFGLRKDGTEFPAEASISKFEVGGEKVLTVRLRDITERKLAEEAVKRSEARFAGIVRISEDAIISIDDNQNITLFNEGAEKIFGYPSAAVLGKNLDLLIPKRFGAVHHNYISIFGNSADALRAMNERGSIYGLRADGTEFPAEASISKFEVGGEKVMTVRLRDITERKRAEEAVKRSEARFAGIVRISEDAIISIDDNQNITLFNEGAEKIFGYTSDEVTGQRIDILIPERFGVVHDSYIKSFGSSADSLRAMNERGSIFGLRKDGTEFPAEASISKFEVAGEKVLTVRLRDITDRKRAEEQIRTSLEEKEVLLKEIHHRVKNNLQVVSSLLSLQSGYPKVEAVRELFVESQNRVKSMALIHEKLYQSKDFSNIDFADYIESLARGLFHSYGVNPDQIALTIEVDVELDIDHAIPCGLILNELLSNSLKHAFPDEQKGAVLLRFHEKENQFTLQFSDNGVGLPEELDFRDTESLGLQLVTTLTSQIGGTIQHVPGKGTVFVIRFATPARTKRKMF